ncbi:hypothetical protein [Halotalea alkalilenta]|uniref:hypothetical protein n=1 Tax=Halotalea alkalilenta TaxID=376489 RepID=UPI0012373ABC|nr:hypothetical protein [Halotalea alkalilenta]
MSDESKVNEIKEFIELIKNYAFGATLVLALAAVAVVKDELGGMALLFGLALSLGGILIPVLSAIDYGRRYHERQKTRWRKIWAFSVGVLSLIMALIIIRSTMKYAMVILG